MARGVQVQRRSTEIGKIRLGILGTSSRGKPQGEQLETFRFTSPDEQTIRTIAELYGGQARVWQPHTGTAPQWEAISETAEVPVYVPRQDIESWYELWAKSLCQRRCDGQVEQIRRTPCLCAQEDERAADPETGHQFRKCKLTTRMSLRLADVPGLGVWGVVSHGYYAASELGSVADVISNLPADIQLPGRLILDRREVKRIEFDNDGEEKVRTSRFGVPVLAFDLLTTRQLAGGENAMRNALGGGRAGAQQAVEQTKQQQAIAQGPDPEVVAERLTQMIADAKDKTTLAGLWRDIGRLRGEFNHDTTQLEQAWRTRASQVVPTKPSPVATEQPETPTTPEAPQKATEPAVDLDPDTEYTALMTYAGTQGWTTAEVNEKLCTHAGVQYPDEATAQQMHQLLLQWKNTHR
jgi:hypothetical protein